MRKSFLSLVVIVLSAIVAGLSPATADASSERMGTGPGASSGGSIGVTLRIPEMIRLSGLEDMDLAWRSDAGVFAAENRLCVYRNGGGAYSVIVASDNGAGNGFVLRGDTSEVHYAVEWNGKSLQDGQSSGVVDEPGHTSRLDCDGNRNVELRVRAGAEQVAEANQLATHTDTLTLTVVAE